MKVYFIVDTVDNQILDVAMCLHTAVDVEDRDHYYTTTEIKVGEITNLEKVPDEECKEAFETVKKLKKIFGEPYDSEN